MIPRPQPWYTDWRTYLAAYLLVDTVSLILHARNPHWRARPALLAVSTALHVSQSLILAQIDRDKQGG